MEHVTCKLYTARVYNDVLFFATDRADPTRTWQFPEPLIRHEPGSDVDPLPPGIVELEPFDATLDPEMFFHLDPRGNAKMDLAVLESEWQRTNPDEETLDEVHLLP